jgi:hypothetical protein
MAQPAPAKRVDTRWWNSRLARGRRLRVQIDNLAKRRNASRTWWSALP